MTIGVSETSLKLEKIRERLWESKYKAKMGEGWGVEWGENVEWGRGASLRTFHGLKDGGPSLPIFLNVRLQTFKKNFFYNIDR